jgi:hypothetical protein
MLGQHRHAVAALGAVVVGVLVYGAFVVPWQRYWGATSEEIRRAMPGDAIVLQRGGTITATEALTIDAPPGQVWPWLVQMGVGRAGFYTLTWVENLLGLGVTNADQIIPELQTLQVGDTVGVRSKEEGARVAVLERGRALTLVDEPTPGYLSTWDFGLYPLDQGHTRLVLRRGETSPDTVARALAVVMEPGYFIMDRGMLLGIKHRAEGGAGQL